MAEMFCPKCDGHGRPNKQIPTRWVAEQHVTEDHGFIPTLESWLVQIQPQPWMNRARPLSRELEAEEAVGATEATNIHRVEAKPRTVSQSDAVAMSGEVNPDPSSWAR